MNMNPFCRATRIASKFKYDSNPQHRIPIDVIRIVAIR